MAEGVKKVSFHYPTPASWTETEDEDRNDEDFSSEEEAESVASDDRSQGLR